MSLSVNRANTNWEELVRVAHKCGFYTREGGRHTVFEKRTRIGKKKVATIPRHDKSINKYTVGEILKSFRRNGCDVETR